MKKRERDAVVELLRAAVDCGTAPRTFAPGSTIGEDAIRLIALDAIKAARLDIGKLPLIDACLEAARRVEEGSWP